MRHLRCRHGPLTGRMFQDGIRYSHVGSVADPLECVRCLTLKARGCGMARDVWK